MTAPAQQQITTLTDLCQQALDLLQSSVQQKPGQLKEEVDQAERMVVQMRNRLIDMLRQDSVSAEAQQRRSALNDVNAALSLIVGTEYSVGGVHRDHLEQAQRLLEPLVTDGRLGTA
jgi:hypothetical protein